MSYHAEVSCGEYEPGDQEKYNWWFKREFKSVLTESSLKKYFFLFNFTVLLTAQQVWRGSLVLKSCQRRGEQDLRSKLETSKAKMNLSCYLSVDPWGSMKSVLCRVELASNFYSPPFICGIKYFYCARNFCKIQFDKNDRAFILCVSVCFYL